MSPHSLAIVRGREGPNLVDVDGNGMAVTTTRGPVRDFPADEQVHGFDTIGQKLVMSGPATG